MTEEISPEEVKEKLDSDEDVQIIDIRSPLHYAQGHIPGSKNIPLPELTSQLHEHEWSDEIIVTCQIGESSVQAARLLKAYEGVDGEARVMSMSGGYEEWEYELDSE
ncbi:MAG: rhodanese-like domain-containing protein [Halobacteria archaeon]|nr:rhodanese-like domain-containing protein [Halobacteria archaeon]